MMCTLCAFIVDAAPRLTDSEITRYTLLCSGSLTGQTKSTRPASVDIGGPLETSVCTFRCREMVINPDAHWQTLEELVHEVAINSGTECEMRAIGISDVDRTAVLSRESVHEFCTNLVHGTQERYNEFCLYVCWLLIDSGGYGCPGTGTMDMQGFRDCFAEQQSFYCTTM
eukprot:Protomagalhaensia_sp_Gyna_25__5926@NODE_904_length_2437_cov_72_136781_g688_i1_p2_GENE_NODE_904_length_2437_cov_72_136781_g688_i1NODE_904_length_2437_cov_72_136781_g688_i1_p2_ORF_typecomplete_len170_score8_42_NODE_904_length_2437_cov_72_136781_g688_i1456965